MGFRRKLKLYFSNLKLRDKFLISYLVLLILPMVLVSYFFHTYTARSAQAQTAKVIAQALKQSSLYINFLMSEIEGIGDIIFNTYALQNTFSTQNQLEYEDVVEARVVDRVFNQIKANPKVHNVRFYVDDSKLYARQRGITYPLSELGKNPYVDKLQHTNKVTGWSVGYMLKEPNGDEKRVVSYIIILKNLSRLDKVAGVVFIDILEKEFSNFLGEIKIGQGEIAFITNEQGEIISKSDPNVEESVLVNRFGQDREVGAVQIENVKHWGEKQYSVISVGLNKKDWRVIYTVPSSEIAKETYAITRFTIVTVFTIILVVVCAAILISNNITSKISKLIRRMDSIHEIRDNEAGLRSKSHREDELGMLEQNFDIMVDRIRLLLKDKYEAGLQKRETELRLLQAQINPHFLYNVLDSINWMAIRAKAMEVSQIITKLGRFYRIGLSKGKDIITVREEIEHVRMYLDLQKNRFGSRFAAEFSIPNEVNDFAIVKLVLQPIVENALVHGILNNSSGQGMISIEAKQGEDTLVISVRDNGDGIDLERVSRLLAGEELDRQHGYGLRNVNERIKLHFGDQYGLSYRRDGGWTIVNITIPLAGVKP